MGVFEKYYDKIALQRANFEAMLEALQESKDLKEKLELAQNALTYAVHNNTGYFSSAILETFFCDYAKEIHADLSTITYKPNSFLHILTQGYHIGGHTRVVERWIANAPSTQIHSVIILKPSSDSLNSLKNNVYAKNGEFIAFDNALNLAQRALNLRKLAKNLAAFIKN